MLISSVRINEKNTILTPFTIIDRLCSPYSFSHTNKEKLADKMELYFHDFSFVPLFMQVRVEQDRNGDRADFGRNTISRRIWRGRRKRMDQ